MATRMQQRRGTAAQWTAANPTLAAGEIGFETDTSKFKMGNGSSNWAALTYFANAAELSAIIDGAPAALNTLNELAAAINDDAAFFTNINSSIINTVVDHNSLALGIHGIADTSLLLTTAHASDTTAIHGIADTSLLLTTAHEADTTSIHGIADTAALATNTSVASAITAEAIVTAAALAAHSSDTTAIHGIADTSLLLTTAHEADTTSIHGIADTAALATNTSVASAITAEAIVTAAALSAHSSDTTQIHGIADTTALVTQTQLTDALAGAEVNQAGLAGVGIDWNTGTEAFDIDSTVATKTYADNAVSTHDSDTTNVHGIANTALLATTADVAAVTKTSLGLANVDNTADTAKPVSTAQSSAIATAKAEAIADATSQVNALLTGAPAALNTLDELAAALGDDANFASSVTTSLGLKVDSLTPISQKTASYTLSLLTERDDLIEMGSASALTLTIPPASAVDYPIGTSIDILQTGAGQVTIAAGAEVTVNATPGLKLRTTWSSATLFKRAANTWVVFGDLTA